MWTGSSTTFQPISSVLPMIWPPLMPPPAIQRVKANGWWSRPVTSVTAAAVLAQRRAAELAQPDDQRRVEQAALLEVLEQGGDRLVGHAGS